MQTDGTRRWGNNESGCCTHFFPGGGPGAYGDSAPNITPDPEHGIGDWSKRDLDFLLEFGMLPNGDFAGDSMSDVIEDNTSHLTPEDRRAIAVYIQSLPPLAERGSD